MNARRWAPEILVALCAHLLLMTANAIRNDFRDPWGEISPARFLLSVVAFPFFIALIASPLLLINLIDRRIQRRRNAQGAGERTVFGHFLAVRRRETFYASAAIAYAALWLAGRYETAKPIAMVVVGALILTVAVHLRLLVITIRVNTGLYGSSEREAREILRFVLSESTNIDISGGLGAKETMSYTEATTGTSLPDGVRA
jgi:hypothetical protein